jgi:hypothetical protein
MSKALCLCIRPKPDLLLRGLLGSAWFFVCICNCWVHNLSSDSPVNPSFSCLVYKSIAQHTFLPSTQLTKTLVFSKTGEPYIYIKQPSRRFNLRKPSSLKLRLFEDTNSCESLKNKLRAFDKEAKIPCNRLWMMAFCVFFTYPMPFLVVCKQDGCVAGVLLLCERRFFSTETA